MINTNKKKLAAILAACAIGATAAAGVSLCASYNVNHAFANTEEEVVTGPAGSEKNPVAAVAGINTVNGMVVGGNAEMGYKELVYYMTFTPSESGIYDFTHSNPDIGVANIYSEKHSPYGDWNDDFTVYSVELIKDTAYTVILNDFDWTVDLAEYEIDDVYALAQPETVTISYAAAAAGSSRDNALPYVLGNDIILPAGYDAVWYTFTVDEAEDLYLISLSGTAKIYAGTNKKATSTAANDYNTIAGASGTYFMQVTPETNAGTNVKLLEADIQSEGSCIATAIALDGTSAELEGGNWYTYTPSADVDVKVNGAVAVDVYEGCAVLGTLYGAADAEETAASLTLKAGLTYHFYAQAYEVNGTLVFGE